MTKPIAHSPPANALPESKHRDGKGSADDSAASAFLALLAALGDAPSADAASNPTGSDASDTADATLGGQLVPTRERGGWPRKADPSRDARQHSGGVENGLPVLPQPMPIMLGTPPVMIIQSHDPGTGGATAGRMPGQVTAQPILGPSGAPGDVLLQPLRPPAPAGAPVRPDVADPTTMPPTDVVMDTLPSLIHSVPGAQSQPGMAGTIPAHVLPHDAAASAVKTSTPQQAKANNDGAFAARNPAPGATTPAATADQGQTTLADTSQTAASNASDGRANPPSARVEGVTLPAGGNEAGTRKATARLVEEPAASSAISSMTGNAMPSGAISATKVAAHPGMAAATQQIVAQAQLLRNGDSAEMRLRLRPPDLGEVQVIVHRSARGDLAVLLIPATRAATEALGANLHHLRAALDPHSHNQHAEVMLRQHGEGGTARQHRHHRHAQEEGDDDDAPLPSLHATTKAVNTTTAPRAGTPASAIDYEV